MTSQVVFKRVIIIFIVKIVKPFGMIGILVLKTNSHQIPFVIQLSPVLSTLIRCVVIGLRAVLPMASAPMTRVGIILTVTKPLTNNGMMVLSRLLVLPLMVLNLPVLALRVSVLLTTVLRRRLTFKVHSRNPIPFLLQSSTCGNRRPTFKKIWAPRLIFTFTHLTKLQFRSCPWRLRRVVLSAPSSSGKVPGVLRRFMTVLTLPRDKPCWGEPLFMVKRLSQSARRVSFGQRVMCRPGQTRLQTKRFGSGPLMLREKRCICSHVMVLIILSGLRQRMKVPSPTLKDGLTLSVTVGSLY